MNYPKVTEEHIESIIKEEFYFTAADGVDGGWAALGMANLSENHPLHLLTFCVLVLENGFIVTGESSCVSPENFDADIGKNVARVNAINKIWLLEGYLLKQKLSE